MPGNHDVDRERIRTSHSLHETVREGKIDGFLENKNKEERDFFVNPKFEAFLAFARRFQQLDETLTITRRDIDDNPARH